jgi:hypothetical protein
VAPFTVRFMLRTTFPLITEGTLLSVKPEDVATIDVRFSPSARFAVNAFLNDQESMLSHLRP